MGATVCKQRQENYGQEVIQDQSDIQLNNFTFAKEQSSKLDRSNIKHPSLKKKIHRQNTEKLPEKVPDDPINLSNNQSNLFLEERQEPTTPELLNNNPINQNGETQHFQNIQLITKEVAQSLKMNSTQKLVSSQQEEVLQYQNLKNKLHNIQNPVKLIKDKSCQI